MGIEKHLPLMEDIKFASGFEDVTVTVGRTCTASFCCNNPFDFDLAAAVILMLFPFLPAKRFSKAIIAEQTDQQSLHQS